MVISTDCIDSYKSNYSVPYDHDDHDDHLMYVIEIARSYVYKVEDRELLMANFVKCYKHTIFYFLLEAVV